MLFQAVNFIGYCLIRRTLLLFLSCCLVVAYSPLLGFIGHVLKFMEIMTSAECLNYK